MLMRNNFVNKSYLFTHISTIVKTYTTNGARTVYVWLEDHPVEIWYFNSSCGTRLVVNLQCYLLQPKYTDNYWVTIGYIFGLHHSNQYSLD